MIPTHTAPAHAAPAGGAWPVQAYSKYALALAYFPDLGAGASADSASRRLRRWIAACDGLPQALAQAGYRPASHHFTARQVRLIFDYLGEP